MLVLLLVLMLSDGEEGDDISYFVARCVVSVVGGFCCRCFGICLLLLVLLL